MTRSYTDIAARDVPSGTAYPVANEGLLLSLFEPDLAPKQQDDYELDLVLTGAGTAEIVVVLKDANGWFRDSETGNLGDAGGQPLPAGAYTLPITNIGTKQQIYLWITNNTGTIAVATAKLTPVKRV